jgi:uncharacterized protein (TIGR03032 family)
MPSALDVIWLVGAPRVGARGLADRLALARGVFSSDPNAPDPIDMHPRLHPAGRGWHSGRLTDADLEPDVAEDLAVGLHARARDRDDHRPQDSDERIRVIDTSPQHALRIPFLAAAFPTSRFVFVDRPAADAVTATLETWRSRRHATYPNLPDWPGPAWTFALVPDWRGLIGRPLEEIAVEQWRQTLTILLGDLEALPSARWCVAAADASGVVDADELQRVAGWLDLDLDRPQPPALPTFAVPPVTDVLRRLLPRVEPAAAQARELFAGDAKPVAHGAAPDFGSAFSAGFPEVLRMIGASLLITTYQSGHLILCRATDNGLNTHFRGLATPMGVAVGDDRFAVGTERWIVTYRNHAQAAQRLGAPYDACFLPLTMHATGDVRVHELAYAEGELWAVSTRFSALVTLSDEHSFVPRWRPPFVSALAAEDRCHLNGFAVRDGRIAYACALGVTDTPGGWRDNKADGGVILDVPSGEVVARGLAMPHSPRWYDDKLWFLESGTGSIAVVDPADGSIETVAQLPGFTRGLSFHGNFAFVGLSQVRESVFRGLPIVPRPDRICGVSVLDVRTGEVLGTLEFSGAVQEIFDVQLLPGLRFPEVGESDGPLLSHSFVLPSVEAAG